MDETQAKQVYKKMVEKASPNSHIITDCLKAFVVGGIICCIGQFFTNIISNFGYTQSETSNYTSVIMILLASVLTGPGWYGKLGKFAGAGSIVPITGFSNSVTAPAIEFKKEGYILGVGAKIFVLAGPVILYGTLTSIVVGAIYYFIK